jgi:hypothetical protein
MRVLISWKFRKKHHEIAPVFPSAFGDCKSPLLAAKRLSQAKSFSNKV